MISQVTRKANLLTGRRLETRNEVNGEERVTGGEVWYSKGNKMTQLIHCVLHAKLQKCNVKSQKTNDKYPKPISNRKTNVKSQIIISCVVEVTPCFLYIFFRLQVNMRIWTPHHIKENYSYHTCSLIIIIIDLNRTTCNSTTTNVKQCIFILNTPTNSSPHLSHLMELSY